MLLNKKVRELYRKNLFSRADIPDDIKFFTSVDFDGLREIPYAFLNEKGDTLDGAFYNYDGYKKGRLVIFDHGMSQCGHRAYMREIEKLCKEGYLVFSYDHTGCACSEGDSMGGFSRSLADLDACLSVLKRDPSFEGYDFSVIGHSWGAYSCLNIGAFHPDVKHIVALSGFISVKDMHKQLFPGVASFFRRTVYKLEAESNPRHVDSNAIEALRKTDAALLCIHSSDDAVVSAKLHFMKLKEALKDRENTKFMLVDGKAHNPNYTADAVSYLGEFFADLTAKRKDGELNSPSLREAFLNGYDFYRMTEQDDEIFKEIFKTLES